MTSAAAHPDRSFPSLHGRPATGWLNDPNGIHFADGRWHVFFQYNPESARHNHITWGHVSSPDMLRWEEHPIALRPDPDGLDPAGCWSGVATVEDGVPTLVYSGVTLDYDRSRVVIARRGADADEWLRQEEVAAPFPSTEGVTAVRDPFLFELDGRRWGIQGAGLADGRGAILLYDTTDLGAWRELGVLLYGDDPVADQLPPSNIWECPQLVRVGDDWVLMVSLWRQDDLTGVGYLVGDLAIDADTGHPSFTPRSHGLIEDNPSFYAPQAVQVDGRVLLWGWARETSGIDGVRGRTLEDSDAVGWTGSLTFPREVVVDGDAARLIPARELVGLRGDPVVGDELPDRAWVELSGAGEASLVLTDGGARQVIWQGTIGVGSSATLLIDASMIEVFPEGARSDTLRAYPEGAEKYRIEAGEGVGVSAWDLRV